jgi:hypothetical protein
MSQIEQLAKKTSPAPTAYGISEEQIKIFPTLSEAEKEGVVLFETLSYHFSSGVVEVLVRHLPDVDWETKLYIAKEIADESGHFTRCASACRALGITPGEFFPDIRRIYGEHPNWLRFMAGCPFTLEQPAAQVFGKFLPRGNRYFQPVKPFVAEDVDHFSHAFLQLEKAMSVSDEPVAVENKAVITDAISESLEHYAGPFFEHLTRIMTLGTAITRSEVDAEWRVALKNLQKVCEKLGLDIEMAEYPWSK